MKFWKWVALYFIGAIFTNSYVRLYRAEEWLKEGLVTAVTPSERAAAINNRDLCLSFSTVFWPVYTAAKAADSILTMRVKVEPPEILNQRQ